MDRPQRLLIVDDELDMLKGLKRSLSLEMGELEITTASKAADALDTIRKEPVDAVLMDIRMPEMDGLELLHHMLKLDQWLTVIMMTAYGSIEIAVDAIKRGAYDFITKPFDRDALHRTLKKGLERSSLIRENYSLQKRLCEKAAFESLVGQSAPMRRLYDSIRAVARTSYTVLIRGESGTGKELVGRAIHELSPRRAKPMVTVNCPAIPEHLLESELFGHKKGAFTGADRDHAGLFDEADGSTILLDEIGDIPVSIQTKLLRVLQEQEVKPLGASKPHNVNVRVLASTNQNLEEKIKDRSFREDLLYRLNVVTIWTPSLTDIHEDIPLLIDHFTRTACCELNIEPKRFSVKALDYCLHRRWPGNVRELQNFVRRAVMLSQGNLIRPEDLKAGPLGQATDKQPSGNSGQPEPYKKAKQRVLDQFTLSYVSDLLEKTGGNISRAAELSGISRVALQKIMRRLPLGIRS